MHFIIAPLTTREPAIWNAWNGIWDDGALYLWRDGTIKGPNCHGLNTGYSRDDLVTSLASSYCGTKEECEELCKKFGHTFELDPDCMLAFNRKPYTNAL